MLLHANVSRLETDPSGMQVRRVALRSLSGRTAQVEAKRVVLCAGGIENARLLLLSGQAASEEGGPAPGPPPRAAPAGQPTGAAGGRSASGRQTGAAPNAA